MNAIIGHCRKCKSPIVERMEIRPNGDTFHEECWADVEAEIQHFNDALDSMDKLTSMHVQFDVNQMREDGVLNKLEDFTVERFKAMMEKRAVESNATTSTITISPTRNDVPLPYKLSCTLTNDNGKFTYKFGGTFWFLWYSFKGSKRIRALWHYYIWVIRDSKTGETFRECVLETIMSILWKSSPNMDAIAERQKPL